MTEPAVAYDDNVNQPLVDTVDSSARRICEFGCGAGGLTRVIRERLPGVHYVGVELMADQLQQARDVLDVPLHRNLDDCGIWTDDLEFRTVLPLNSFDHVIFGDVLEHLYDPQTAIDQAALRLAPGGSALVCIPNVQHWRVFVQLVLGSWPQAGSGLFDRTHIDGLLCKTWSNY